MIKIKSGQSFANVGFQNQVPTTPAFVIDEVAVIDALLAMAKLRNQGRCKVLYAVKALPLMDVLELVQPYVDGFSASSLFEARLAKEVLTSGERLHLSAPGVKPDDVQELARLCSHISCNSVNQYKTFADLGQQMVSLGLRVNPKLSFASDLRFDPCRPNSKLGISIDDLLGIKFLNEIRGLHVHSNFSSHTYRPLVQTLEKLKTVLDKRLVNLQWLNLGGGYWFGQIPEDEEFIFQLSKLQNDFGLEIFIEPGNAIVGNGGYLLATVIDCFKSDGKTVAVLDTSVNHLPMVFEYQRPPEVAEHDENGDYPIILAGNTCLAGDILGEYRFNQPLAIGARVIFIQVGAYSLVKANRFNGYNLPDIYSVSDEGIKRIKQFTYQEYRQFWMGDA